MATKETMRTVFSARLDGDTLLLTITEQQGIQRGYGRIFVALNGVRLLSCGRPGWSPETVFGPTLYLLGTLTEYDTREIRVPLADWPRLADALQEATMKIGLDWILDVTEPGVWNAARDGFEAAWRKWGYARQSPDLTREAGIRAAGISAEAAPAAEEAVERGEWIPWEQFRRELLEAAKRNEAGPLRHFDPRDLRRGEAAVARGETVPLAGFCHRLAGIPRDDYPPDDQFPGWTDGDLERELARAHEEYDAVSREPLRLQDEIGKRIRRYADALSTRRRWRKGER